MTQYPTPANLIVHCEEHLENVRKFADETNQRADFEKQLEHLTSSFFGQEIFVQLYSDWAPQSFYFLKTADREGKQVIFNGGLIYHGQIPNLGGGAPTFSVCLTPTSGWAIHT